MELSLAQRFQRLLANDFVSACVPDHNGACTIVAWGNCAFKIGIFDRMILHFDGKPPISSLCWNSLRYRPGLQDTIHFQAEIIVKPGGSVFLNDKHRFAVLRNTSESSSGFLSVREISFS